MTLADRLALATAQLSMTSELLAEHGTTAGDLLAVAKYLDAITEHGHRVCGLALRAVDRSDSEHPVRSATHGFDLQASLAHAMSLLDAAMHFAADAQQALSAMNEGEATS